MKTEVAHDARWDIIGKLLLGHYVGVYGLQKVNVVKGTFQCN